MNSISQFICVIALSIATIFNAKAQLLWKVSKPDVEKASYLIGTHHLAPINILDSIQGWNDALNNCDIVFGEVDKDSLTSPASQQMMLSAAIAPADSSIYQLYTPLQIDSINTFLIDVSNGIMSVNTFANFKPAFINTQVSLLLAMKAMPQYNPQQQLDIHIQQQAINHGKTVAAFETAKQQIDLLFNYPIEQQAQELLSTMRNEAHLVDFSKQLASAYLTQNLDSVHRLSLHPTLGTDPESQARLIDNRNKTWVNTLLNILPQKSVIVCVGALHLPGNNGLIKLLRNQGYIVTPITK